MKSSSAPNKTPSLKKGLWPFFLLPLFPPFFLLCFFSCPLLLLLHPRETCLPYLHRRTTQERWLRHRCVCAPVRVCVFARRQHWNCTLHSFDCITRIFRTFAVNINACPYLHGSLTAVCLLVLACTCVLLILWAKVGNERQKHIADGEVREALKLPTVGLYRRAAFSLPSSSASCWRFSPFWTQSSFLSLFWCHISVLSSQTFCSVSCLLFFLYPPFSFILHLVFSFLPHPLSPYGNLISPSSWPVHSEPTLHGW